MKWLGCFHCWYVDTPLLRLTVTWLFVARGALSFSSRNNVVISNVQWSDLVASIADTSTRYADTDTLSWHRYATLTQIRYADTDTLCWHSYALQIYISLLDIAYSMNNYCYCYCIYIFVILWYMKCHDFDGIHATTYTVYDVSFSSSDTHPPTLQ